ncbi:L-ascorbate metabolism protein UlaG, beta-lactamase superfamily [Sinomicrobium oceani]|uniref:L-ascorbate metabolism protein UlaG, beta-lactamase superfamily n=1 Tax=Sinomicrobium oceani TaxID=1150368 RepID=A0A1K1MTT7_9FLAO|nr:MBL fold metallo-hydrolase [Sinomicrobium oceani]SFW26511.1 L-ascorbate metabolism protein UlaG, beta-lactamase superfamily [Sinomicrobium oceani]
MKSYTIGMALGALLSLGYSPVFSQIQPDTLATENGRDIILQPIFHGTLALEWNNVSVYIDPYGGVERFSGVKPPDIVLITDIHGDHLDTRTLEALETSEVTFIVPQAVADQLPDAYKKNLVILKNGESKEISGITIGAIPMYNLPASKDAPHVKGRGNGYLLSLDDKKIYISGDTGDIPEMRALRDIDVAFVCMNLPYTMPVEKAADAVLDFKPAVVYPYHYRGNPDMSDTEKFKKLVDAGHQNTEVRLRNWYP